jgi:hypothetical protein
MYLDDDGRGGAQVCLGRRDEVWQSGWHGSWLLVKVVRGQVLVVCVECAYISFDIVIYRVTFF